MKFLLERKLQKKLRQAKVHFQAGSTSLVFALEGTSVD